MAGSGCGSGQLGQYCRVAHDEDVLAGDERLVAGEPVDDVKGDGDVFCGVDHGRDDGHMVPPWQEPVAVRWLVAIEAPDAPVDGGAAGVGGAELADDGTVDRLP